jgi:hypothetical protein
MVQRLHRWSQSDARTGLFLEKLPNRAFLQGLARRCFKNRFMQERG